MCTPRIKFQKQTQLEWITKEPKAWQQKSGILKLSRMPGIGAGYEMGEHESRWSSSGSKEVWNISDSWKMASHWRFCRREETHRALSFQFTELSSGQATPPEYAPRRSCAGVGEWKGRERRQRSYLQRTNNPYNMTHTWQKGASGTLTGGDEAWIKG